MTKKNLYNNLIKHKAVIIAIIFIVLFFIFESIGIGLNNQNQKYKVIRNDQDSIILESQEQKESSNIISSDVFFALSSACLGIGLLSFAWELLMQKSWLEIVRENILDSLCKPEVAKYINDEWKLKVVNQLLNIISGETIGNTLFNEIKNNTFSESLLRENFTYNITLTDKDSNFYNASFYIQFDVFNINKDLSVRLAKQDNSLEIHNFYQSLVKNNDIYRYILYTSNTNIPTNCFEIEKCIISSNSATNETISLTPCYPATENIFEESISLIPNTADITTYKKICKSKSCKLTMKINTIIDKSWNYFPIMFGYPVKGFKTRFDIKDCNISEINIMEFFTSSDNFIRDESIHESITAAAGSIDNIILPDSGLVYVWK